MAAAVHDPRRAMLAKVHLGAKQLGLSDDARRDLMFRVTGRRSAADMTMNQLDHVLSEYRRLGWKPEQRQAAQSRPAGRRAPPADHPVARKARALWLGLHRLEAIQNPSEQALEAFAKRQVGCDAMRFMDQAQGFKLIEALKRMAGRAGWDQDVGQLKGEAAGALLQERLDALIEARNG